MRSDPGRIDPGDRAAAGADLDDVHHRHLDRVARERRRALDVVLAAHAHLAALDERGLRGGAADVERDQVRLADEPSDLGSADHAADRTGLDEVDRRLGGHVEARHPAVRLHREASLGRDARGVEPRREPPR